MDTKEKNEEKKNSSNALHKVINAFRVGDSENKRASAPPWAGTYFGNAQLQGHYPRHNALGTNWVFYGPACIQKFGSSKMPPCQLFGMTCIFPTA